MKFPIIFVALKPPYMQRGMDRKMVFVKFQIALDEHAKKIAPEVCAQLEAEGKTYVDVMFAHADESGNIHPTARDALAEFKPDLLWTCFPAEVRRLNPGLPIQGYSKKSLISIYEQGTNIVRLEEE